MGNGFNGSLVPSRGNSSGEQIGKITGTAEVVEDSIVGAVVVIITLVVTVMFSISLTGIQAKLVLLGFG